MRHVIKKIVAVTLMLGFICLPMNSVLQAQETAEVNYELLFKAVMDEIKQSYLYGDEISKKELFEAAMKGMFDKLDPYSEFQTPVENQVFTNSINQSYVGIGVGLMRVDDKTMITEVFNHSPAQEAGVIKGDYFKAVDGIDVTNMAIDELLIKVLGEEGTLVNITFGRGRTSYSVDILRAQINIASAETVPISELYRGLDQVVEDQIGYIAISSFSETVYDEFSEALQDVKVTGANYLILDLRDNGGGYVSEAVKVAQKIIPAGPIVSFKNNTGEGMVYTSERVDVPFQIVALINENSGSATEFVAGAIQDSGVGLLVGETTYGKGVAQYLLPFVENYTIKLTEEEFFTRNGHKVNGVGVTPDYVVEIPTFISGNTKYYLYDESEEVILLEKILNYLGYHVGTPDQVFDKKTFEGVKNFQLDHNLYGYGACDFGTAAALNEALQASILEYDPQLNKAFELIIEKMSEK